MRYALVVVALGAAATLTAQEVEGRCTFGEHPTLPPCPDSQGLHTFLSWDFPKLFGLGVVLTAGWLIRRLLLFVSGWCLRRGRE